MHWQASFTVALGGSVTGSWFLTISDIFRTVTTSPWQVLYAAQMLHPAGTTPDRVQRQEWEGIDPDQFAGIPVA